MDYCVSFVGDGVTRAGIIGCGAWLGRNARETWKLTREGAAGSSHCYAKYFQNGGTFCIVG